MGSKLKCLKSVFQYSPLSGALGIAIAVGCLPAKADIVAKIRSNTIQAAAAPEPGAISVTLNMPFEKISSLANHFTLTFNSSGKIANLFSYQGTLTLGQVSVGRSDTAAYPVRVSAPFRLKGVFAGYDIDRAGDAAVDVAVAFGPDWCPAVTFDDPSVVLSTKERLPEKVAKSIPNFGDFVAAKFLGNELRAYVTCDALKSVVAKQWGSLTFPVSAGAKMLYVSMDPQTIGLSAVTVTDSRLELTVTLGGVIGISAKSAKVEAKALPQVQVIAPLAMKNQASNVEAVLAAPINLNFK